MTAAEARQRAIVASTVNSYDYKRILEIISIQSLEGKLSIEYRFQNGSDSTHIQNVTKLLEAQGYRVSWGFGQKMTITY